MHMGAYRVALFGHRDLRVQRAVEEHLFPILCDLIRTKEYVEFYIGRNGEFDTFVASVIKRVQNFVGNANNDMTLVLPYVEKDIIYYEEYYDRIVIPDCVSGIHPKGAITRRNRWMVEECDLFVCYVERESGGAYTALKYARRLGKNIVNLAEEVSSI